MIDSWLPKLVSCSVSYSWLVKYQTQGVFIFSYEKEEDEEEEKKEEEENNCDKI